MYSKIPASEEFGLDAGHFNYFVHTKLLFRFETMITFSPLCYNVRHIFRKANTNQLQYIPMIERTEIKQRNIYIEYILSANLPQKLCCLYISQLA